MQGCRGWIGRGQRLAALLMVIGAGLALRRFGYDLGLPFWIVKYGGSALWGAMVLLLLAALTGARRTSWLVVAALALAIGVELFRHYHTPALDAFRLTVVGQLLLGRVFSLWNIVAYAIGIGLAACIDSRVLRQPSRTEA